MTEQTLPKTTILAQFLSSADQFVAVASGLPEPLLDCSSAPGEWTIRQIVHHVSDDADLWCFALKKAVASPGSPIRFEGFPGNERWFAALGFSQRPVKAALALIQAHHQVMAEIATFAYQEWDQAHIELFDDKGSPLGNWTPGQILQMLTGHMNQHLQTIQNIRRQAGW